VVIAAIVMIFFPDYYIIDPICTFVFSAIVLFTTIPILLDCIRVFMEGTPKGLDTNKLFQDLNKVIYINIGYRSRRGS
jgi:zinc transporter 2